VLADISHKGFLFGRLNVHTFSVHSFDKGDFFDLGNTVR